MSQGQAIPDPAMKSFLSSGVNFSAAIINAERNIKNRKTGDMSE